MATPKKAWRPVFLQTLANTGNVRASCLAAGVNPVTAYRTRDRSEAFAQQWAEAERQATQLLEAEAWRRAAQGVEKGIYHQGERIATERQYSDTLLIFLLKARDPAKYRENHKVEMSGPDGGPIPVDATVHTPDAQTWAEILAIRESVGDVVADGSDESAS